MTEENVKIIKLDPNRWQEYKNLRLKALELEPTAFASSVEEESGWPKEKWVERLTNWLEGKEEVGYFAEINRKLVGLMFAKFGHHIKTRHTATIMGVFVDPNYRGQGIAKKLMETLLKDLESRPEIVRIWLDVECERIPALNLYKSFGFKLIGRLEKCLKVGDKFYDYFELEKIIR